MGFLIWGCQPEKDTPSRTLSEIALAKTAVKAEAEGKVFRDLNQNGVLDLYEDINAPVEERVADLISQMTLEE